MKTFAPPTHCPLCGVATEVVRHIGFNAYEMACAACDRTAVVLVDDYERIREPAPFNPARFTPSEEGTAIGSAKNNLNEEAS